MKYKIHEYCDAFPDLPKDELEALAQDIKTNGLQYPIRRYGGKIIDGKNRLAACELAGETPIFVDWHPKARDPVKIDEELFHYVIGINMKRRHMDKSALATTAVRLADHYKKIHGEPAKAEKNGESESVKAATAVEAPTTLEKAAEAMGVSPRLVDQAAAVVREGSAPVQRAVESGEVSAGDAAAIVGLSADKQNEALKKVRSGKAKTLRQAAGKRAKKPSVKPVRGNAALDFDDSVVDGHFAFLKKAIDERGRVLKDKGKEFAKCHAELNKFYDAWRAWKKLRK